MLTQSETAGDSMKRFYGITGKARSSDGTAYFEYSKQMPLRPMFKVGPIESWEPPLGEFRGGPLSDLLNNDTFDMLCSAKLRDAIEGGKSDADSLQWLDAIVEDEKGKEHIYFVMHLPEPHDVLNKTLTTHTRQGHIIRPAISVKLAELYNIFRFDADDFRFYLSDSMRKVIKEANCTNVVFDSILTV